MSLSIIDPNSNPPPLVEISAKPELGEMRDELKRCTTEATIYLEQYRHDFETRYCLWDGQSRDGRRWQENLGTNRKARPWDGASDVRTMTADEIIIEQVDVMMAAFARASIQVTALQPGNLDWSTKITVLLNWMFRNQMATEIDAELEKVLNWRQTYGLSIMGIWWLQDLRLVNAVVTLDEMLQAAMQHAQQGNTQPLQSLADPMMDERTISEMIKRSPILDRQAARKILKDLRTNGQATVPRVSVLRNQPCWEALRPFLDVFFPTETTNLQRSRWVQRRRLFTLTELLDKVNRHELDKDWAMEVAKTRGKSFGALNDYRDLPLRRAETMLAQVGTGGLPNENYVEVWDAYYTGIDSRTGVPVMQHTTWSPLVSSGDDDGYGRHEAFGYQHGQQPFVPFVRERVESALADSRSVCEISSTFQATIKNQRDNRNDLAQMSTIPPLLVPTWRAGAEVPLGPAAQLPEKTQGELRFMTLPTWTGQTADKAESTADLALGRYFGLMREGVDPQRIQLSQERLVGKVMKEIGEVGAQTLGLMQQYMSDVQCEQIVGPLRMPFQVSREEIQGRFTLLLHFDPSNLNQALVQDKLKGWSSLLQMDTQGVMNRAGMVKFGARLLDPFDADSLVGSPDQAAQSESEDEMRDLAGIACGVEPPMRPEGQNYQLRLQTLMQGLQQNPWLQQRIASQPDSAAMLKARIQHLQVMAEQYGVNAQTGRTGAEPGLDQLQAQMQKQQQGGAPGGGQPGGVPQLTGGPQQ